MEKPFTIDKDTALILEGGGMRGVFTVGVLDYFLERGLRFPLTVGVSAGACNGLSFMSRQKGRAKCCNIDILEKYQYIGIKYLFTKQRNIMNFDLMFNDIPERIYPYDYDAYRNNPDRFVIVTTDCNSGRACYFEEKNDKKRLMDITRASSSLPFVTPIASVDGTPMLDGGIADSIPVEYARSRGFKKFVIVLTRNSGYRKEEKNNPLCKFFYRKYPNMRKAINARASIYNRTMELIEELEREGNALVIRPEKPIKVGRMEKNIDRLTALYEEGYNTAAKIDIR